MGMDKKRIDQITNKFITVYKTERKTYKLIQVIFIRCGHLTLT